MPKAPPKTSLNAHELRELLDYDRTTGVFRWRTRAGSARQEGDIAGCVNYQGYVVIGINYVTYQAHRLAWLHEHGEWPAYDLDHRDRVRSNNAIANLRLASDSTNQANSVRYSRSLPKGVTFHKVGRKFQAAIKVNGRSIYLGLHDTAELAHTAYVRAAILHFGEFARMAP